MTDATDETTDETLSPGSFDAVDETVVSGEGPAPSTRVAGVPARGTLIARYVVLSKLGAGAMGVVLAAYDPDLDRKVAIKLLKARPGRDSEAARARLQREAQALAKLNHTNVVAVHDVGVHEGQVFVAMEYVDGQTLGGWMASGTDGRPRPWREVLGVFEAAGRGLAAAHDEGLIHRDFKPDNVMLGEDGRVRVMDFGLARLDDDDPSRPVDLELLEEQQSVLDTPLTQTGAMLGTPAYMAPEQFTGEGVTAHSDQFGFCVALFEALHGRRPFRGESLGELVMSVTEGTIDAGAAPIPRWLGQIVARGLSVNPTRRFGDMRELLNALGAGEVRGRRARWMGASGVGALAVAGVFAADRWDESRRDQACVDEGDAIERIWNPTTRERLRQAIATTGVPDAELVAHNTLPWLDKYAEAWRSGRTSACRRATVERTWRTEIHEQARWCLDYRRSSLEALITEMSSADENVVPYAVSSAAQLSAIDPCVNHETLVAMPTPPTAGQRPEVESVRADLSRASYFMVTGKYSEALEVTRAATAQAEAIAWAPLVAQALAYEAVAHRKAGDYAAGEAVGIDAYIKAVRASDWALASQAAQELVFVVGYKQSRAEEGLVWSRHALAMIEHGGDPLGLREADILGDIASVHQLKGEYAESKALDERALATNEPILGPDHPEVAVNLNNLAIANQALGDRKTARAQYERALDIRERSLGPTHPRVGQTLGNLASILHLEGDVAGAKALYERALEIEMAALGSEHPDISRSLYNLAEIDMTLGNPAAARDRFARSLSIFEKAIGAEDPNLAYPLGGLGNALTELGQYAEAIPLLERAIRLREAAESPPIRMAYARFVLADARWNAPGDGRDQVGARNLALQALQAYTDAGDAGVSDRAEVQAWLDSHPAP